MEKYRRSNCFDDIERSVEIVFDWLVAPMYCGVPRLQNVLNYGPLISGNETCIEEGGQVSAKIVMVADFRNHQLFEECANSHERQSVLFALDGLVNFIQKLAERLFIRAEKIAQFPQPVRRCS